MYTLKYLFFVMILGMGAMAAHAQVAMPNRVVGLGGGVSANASVRIAATMGQPLVGRATNASVGLTSGFWATARSVTSVSIEVPHADTQPESYQLHSNYPNPFNPVTTIGFEVPEAGRVTVTVYDALGRLVQTVTDRSYPPGRHAIAFEAGNLPSGMYLYRMEAASFRAQRTMILLK